MNFLINVSYLWASLAAPVCALGAYTNWSVLHEGPIGHAGWAVLMLVACIISIALLLFAGAVVCSVFLGLGMLALAVTFAGVGLYFAPIILMFSLATFLGGGALEMISFELVCGLLFLLVIFACWTVGFEMK